MGERAYERHLSDHHDAIGAVTLVKALHPDGIQDPVRRQLMDEAMKILNVAVDAFKGASAIDPFGDHPFADWVRRLEMIRSQIG